MRRRGIRLSGRVAFILALIVALGAAGAGPAYALCLSTGSATTCSSFPPNPWPLTVGVGPLTPSGYSVTLLPNAQVQVTNANAISLGNNATILLQSGAVVQTTTNSGAGNGLYGDGSNTIDVNNNSTITINAGASVVASGTQSTSEAINPFGTGNTIINFGLIEGGPSSAIYFQNVGANANSPRNVVENFGTIEALPNGSNPTETGQAIGSQGNVGIDFVNETGATVIGNLDFQGGNDNVTLLTGSKITGSFNGGGGFNTLTLDAAAGASDSLSGTVTNFQTLTKTGAGTWTLTGTIGDVTASGSAPLAVAVEGGTLQLTGNNTNFNGSIVVNPGVDLATPGPDPSATLEARAQSLPPLITDHGIVLINQVSPDGIQPADGTYAGLIQGTGVVTKIGSGTLTLTGTNTYSGGTNFDQGTVSVGADAGLGAATGPLTFNGGTLQFGNSFALSAARTITLNAANGGFAGGGTFDTQGFTGTLPQGITGAGGLTKIGSGTLVLAGNSSYTGGTTIAAGTLQLGNGGTSGAIVGDVTDNGTLAFDRTDSVTFPGTISGGGGVTQIGSGTTILTADNTYTGGTTIGAGTLQLGNGGTSGAIVGDVTDNGTLAFDRTDSVTFPGTISGSGAVTQIGSGTTILTADNGFTGPTDVSAGTLAIGDGRESGAALSGGGAVSVGAGGTLGGYGSVAGPVNNAGTIAVADAVGAFAGGPTGTFTLDGSLANAGTLAIGGTSIGNVLAVGGAYSSTGGRVLLNTLLNAGGPLANQVTDRLLVSGGASGVTEVGVHATGSGAVTSIDVPISTDGISIIQVAGPSSVGAFSLAGGYVDGGTPYQYHLFAYGPGSPNGAAAYSQNLVGNQAGYWDYRLQNVFVTPEGPLPPVPEPPNPGPPGPPGPPVTPPPPPDARPEVVPQVPAYLTAPVGLFNAGLQNLDELHRRLGEIRDDQAMGRTGPYEVFLRGFGGNYNYTSNRSFQAFGYNGSDSYSALQFGANWIAVNDQAGTLRVGLAGTLGRFWMTPFAVDGASKALFNTQTAAAIGTWQARAGWYVDAIVSGGAFDGAVSTPARGRTTGLDGSSVGVSVEAGYPVGLPAGFSLEPEAQIVYQHLNFGKRTDVDGIPVDIGGLNQTVGRLGARLVHPFAGPDGSRVTPYAKVNLLQGFGSSGAALIGGQKFGIGNYGSAVQVGGGVTGSLAWNVSAYTDVAWQQNVGGNGGFRGWSFNGGVRFLFGAARVVPPAVAAAPAPVPARSYLVFFDWDRADLSARARQVVAHAAAAALQEKLTRIRVQGYADTSGAPVYNQELSLRRAEAVAAALVQDGVHKDQIAIRAFGATHLLVPTGPGVREPQNRRVEIIVG